MKKLLFLILLSSTSSFSQGTWQLIPTPVTSYRIDDIYFTSDSVGYFGSNQAPTGVYKTIDRGNSWSMIFPTTQSAIRSIEFANDSVGFYGLLAGGGSQPGSLYKTHDAGLTWERDTTMQMGLYDGICGIAHYGNSVLAVGTYSTPARVYISNDLGDTWNKIDMSAYASGLVDCYMFSEDTILVSGIANAANNTKAIILKSNDGGATWQQVFLASQASTYCWKMFFRPNGLGLASIEMGAAVARTTDYGNTWTEIPINDPAAYDVGAIGLLNDSVGYVTSQSNLGYSATWMTTDGGLSWDSVNTVVECGDRMIVLDDSTAFISGRGIFKYSPTVTGLSQHIKPGKPIHSIRIYPNPATGFINVDLLAGCNTFGLVDVLDAKGNIITQVTRQLFSEGKHSFRITTDNLSAGVYKVLWRNNQVFLSENFVVR